VHACTLTHSGSRGPNRVYPTAPFLLSAFRGAITCRARPRRRRQGSSNSCVYSSPPCLPTAVLSPLPPRYRSHRHAPTFKSLLTNYTVSLSTGLFQMSSERPTAPCGVPLLPAVTERPHDESNSITRNPGDADKFFTFLTTCTVAQLRARLREMGQTQRGDKNALSFRIFRKVATDAAASGDWLQAAGAEYGEWIGSPEGQLATWKSAPCSEELSGVVLRIGERPVGGTIFSVTDFARLCVILTQDEQVRCSLVKSGKNLSRSELDAGVRRDDFWSTTVAPRYNDPKLQISEHLFVSLSAMADERKKGSYFKPTTTTPVPRSGEDLREKFFRIRALFSECHRRWSLSGQMDPDAFPNFLPVRSGGGASHDGQKALVLFRALRCGEPDEDTEALNFTTKIAPEGVRIELGSKESPDTPTPTLSARPKKRKHEKGIHSQSDDGNLLEVMNKVAESMTAGSSADNGYSEKRSRLGAHRKAETESLMKLLSQKRELRESGLSEEDTEIMNELEVEIKSCKNRLRHFRKEEEELM
jgi:hypothetical protein